MRAGLLLIAAAALTGCNPRLYEREAECVRLFDELVMPGIAYQRSNGEVAWYDVRDPNGIRVSVDYRNSPEFRCRITEEVE